MSESPTWTGLPPDPSVDGAHWLQEKRQRDTGAIPGPTFLAQWSVFCERWFYFGVSAAEDAASMAERCDYLGPVVYAMERAQAPVDAPPTASPPTTLIRALQAWRHTPVGTAAAQTLLLEVFGALDALALVGVEVEAAQGGLGACSETRSGLRPPVEWNAVGPSA